MKILRREHILPLAWLLSCLVHALVLVAPGWELPEPPGEALRIRAELAAAEAPAVPQAPRPKAVPRRKSVPSVPGAPSVHMPDAPPAPVAAASTPAPETSSPLASVSDPSANPVVVAAEKAAEPPAPSSSVPAAERLPHQGRVGYSGTASLLSVMGIVSWEHDGAHYKARLGAGVLGASTTFNYESSGLLVGAQVVSEQTHDSRRGRVTTAEIDNPGGVVRMQRGDDQRERRIAGLAVALSSLPEALACLDERIEKAALFIVGDFWVEDAVVINRGMETLDLPGGQVAARRFQSRISNGKTIDIWLAPAWRNAPARIRYDDGGVVVDLKATEVEIDGQILWKTATSTSGS